MELGDLDSFLLYRDGRGGRWPSSGGGWNGEATGVPPAIVVVGCGWTGMEAGKSCSQWLALAVVEGGTSGDADAAGSRRGSGGGGRTGFIKREEGGFACGVETEEARVGIGTNTELQLHFSLSTCTVLDI